MEEERCRRKNYYEEEISLLNFFIKYLPSNGVNNKLSLIGSVVDNKFSNVLKQSLFLIISSFSDKSDKDQSEDNIDSSLQPFLTILMRAIAPPIRMY